MSKRRRKQLPRFVITGFDPFVGAAVNPSQQIVERLFDSLETERGPVKLVRQILPTCCQQSWSSLKKTVRRVRRGKKRPFILVSVGFAEGRSALSIERFALNLQDYRVPDNSGHIRQNERLSDDAPDALRTPFNPKGMADHLNDKGFPCEISNHAGTFVCNELYFKSLRKWGNRKGRRQGCLGVLFLHVPSPQSYARLVEARNQGEGAVHAPVDALEHMTAALEELCRFLILQSGEVEQQ